MARHAVAFLAYLALTVALTWPLVTLLGAAVPQDLGDPILSFALTGQHGAAKYWLPLVRMRRGRVPLLPLAVAVFCSAALARLLWVLVGYYMVGRAERHHLETAWLIFISVAIAAAACLPAARWTAALPSRAVAGPAMVAACIAASLLLYYRSLDVGLLSDDFVLLALSPFAATDWQFFRPLPLVAWTLIHPLAGPAGLHVMNAALHGINAFLVYRLTQTLLPHAPPMQSVVAAAVFLTFPAAVEPVTWIAGVFDVALVTAGLLYVNALLSGSRSRSVALLSLGAALLCKETAVVLPVIGWTLRLVAPVPLRTLAWSTAMAAAYAATRMFFSDPPDITAPLGYFFKEMTTRPFATLGTPFTSAELSAAPILFGVIPQVLVAGLIATYLLHTRHGMRPLLPASWILLGVAPLLSYLFISDTLQGSRYLYLPLVGWSILIAQLSDGGDNRSLRRGGALLIALIVSYGVVGTVRHQAPWSAAAATRDAVLIEARRAMAEQQCGAAAFTDVPDSQDGAYVFRNGFAEAGQQAGVRVVTSDPAPAGCTFAWREGSFVATPEASDSDSPRTK